MHRRIARPYGQSVTGVRLVSMLMAVLVLSMLYSRLKDPATWRAFADEGPAPSVSELTTGPVSETVVFGPNDLDAGELEAAGKLFELVIDRAPLKPREMDAYWRLMDWSRTQPFADMEERAKTDVPFTQLWEQPEKYRGQLVRLRLHVRRVLEYDAPENPSGIGKVCEAWGWTDESRSFPYTVVFPEPPEGLPVGTDIRTEIVFVGYFLKVMSYTAFDRARGAPLLVGRARLVPSAVAAAPSKSDPWLILLVIAAGILFIGFSVWTRMKSRRKVNRHSLPNDFSSISTPVLIEGENPFELIAAGHPASDSTTQAAVL